MFIMERFYSSYAKHCNKFLIKISSKFDSLKHIFCLAVKNQLPATLLQRLSTRNIQNLLQTEQKMRNI